MQKWVEEGILGAGNLWVDRGATTLFKLKLKDWKEPNSHLNRQQTLVLIVSETGRSPRGQWKPPEDKDHTYHLRFAENSRHTPRSFLLIYIYIYNVNPEVELLELYLL